MALVDRRNATFPRGVEFPAEVDRVGFRSDWDALDAATRALEGRMAEDRRLGLGVASAAMATALDARSRLDTLSRLATGRGRGGRSLTPTRGAMSMTIPVHTAEAPPPLPARSGRRGSNAVAAGRRIAATVKGRVPGAARTTRAGARGTTSTLQLLPDSTLRWLAASSIGLATGLQVAGAPRLARMAGFAPAVFAGAAIVLRTPERAVAAGTGDAPAAVGSPSAGGAAST